MRSIIRVILLIAFSIPAIGQTLDEGPTDGSFSVRGTEVNIGEVKPLDPGWESGYQSRITAFLNSATWNTGSGNADPDDGKREWSKLLAMLEKVKNDPAQVQSLITTKGRDLQNSQWAGSFFKPFSCPGYTLYYKRYYGVLPSDQRLIAENMVKSTGFTHMSRVDGKMDPIYANTEKNSENFAWMSRLMGCIWAHQLNDAAQINFFDEYVKGWVRSIYSTERVEWNSCVYFGYTFVPALVLYEYAPDAEIKKRAKAVLDYMMIDLALHWIDGATTGPDARAKPQSYKTFAGTSWLWGYLFFADATNHPSYPESKALSVMAAHNQMVGFPPNSSYRPHQVALDIAHRKFALPVELHGAKPFYQADYDDYKDWQGKNGTRSRRFDFETLYLDRDYTLGSVATNYPQGIDCFWEQSVWKLAVRGSGNGAIQIAGNSGGFPNANYDNGRCPYEQIGQYRNVMMRVVKGADHSWVCMPKTIPATFDGPTLFADMGSNVYVALVPYAATSTSSAVYSNDTASIKYVWNYNSAALGALTLEVGSAQEHGSFAQFKSAIKAKTSFSRTSGADVIEYTATSGRKLKMEFMPIAHRYPYWRCGVNAACPGMDTIADAGVVPKVWVDGKYLDFSTWQSWHVSSGEPIVEQNWGSGALTATVGGKGIQIAVDPTTANVRYRSISQTVSLPRRASGHRNATTLHPTRDGVKITGISATATARLFDVNGRQIASGTEGMSVDCHSSRGRVLILQVYDKGILLTERRIVTSE